MERVLDTIRVEFIPPKKGKWLKPSKWKLLEDYISDNGKVEVPVGFITDGATIPYVFRRIFSPTGRYFGAAIIHDYVLVSECDWDKANKEFELEMRSLDVEGWRLFFMVLAVKIHGKIHKLLGRGCYPHEVE